MLQDARTGRHSGGWVGARGARRFVAAATVVAGVALFCASALQAMPPGYAGDETCAACHENLLDAYRATTHAKVLNERNARSDAMKLGCESCHGPGAAHVEAGGGRGVGGPGWISFAPASGQEVQRQNAVCLGCHEGGRRLNWHGSAHDSRGVACTSCHDPMRNVSPDHLLRRSNQTDTCAQCHLLPRAQVWRNSHMPLRVGPASRDLGSEGFMTCTSCHNPHGTITEKLIDAHSVNDKCYSCHADKRGPFLWEHAPVNESCLNCHQPHGSAKPNMLTLEPPRLCNSCHTQTLHPSEARLPENRFVVSRGCVNCHQRVHGSNHPSGMVLTR